MNAIALIAGVLIFALLLDRMRMINWHNTKPAYVTQYLASALWTLGLFDEAIKGAVEFYQFGAVLATLIWLLLTRSIWAHGPPEHTKAQP